MGKRKHSPNSDIASDISNSDGKNKSETQNVTQDSPNEATLKSLPLESERRSRHHHKHHHRHHHHKHGHHHSHRHHDDDDEVEEIAAVSTNPNASMSHIDETSAMLEREATWNNIPDDFAQVIY